MTNKEQYVRALKGQETARDALRKGGDDASVNHWAARLVFWLDEAKRLQNEMEG